MNGLISYRVIIGACTEADAKRAAEDVTRVFAWRKVVARPRSANPVTGYTSGLWEVVEFVS